MEKVDQNIVKNDEDAQLRSAAPREYSEYVTARPSQRRQPGQRTGGGGDNKQEKINRTLIANDS